MSLFGIAKGLVAGSIVIAAGLEPVSNSDPDLWRYAITQGGIFSALMIVLWFYRRDFIRFQEKDQEKVAVLMALAERTALATEHSSAAVLSNKESVDRLARALEGRMP